MDLQCTTITILVLVLGVVLAKRKAVQKDKTQLPESSKEKQLIRFLLERYKKLGRMGRPVNDTNNCVDIEYGLDLIQILDLDERNQILTTNVWGNYRWKDIFLTWDPEDYGNVTAVRLPTKKIWLPDIKLYNYADTRLTELREALAVVYSDGTILWVPQAIYKSSCSIDIAHFPFDEQVCTMKFGSWTYDGFKLDIFFFDNGTGLSFGDYIQSNEWDIVHYSSEKRIKRYQCCPEPYPSLNFTLQLRRRAAFYNYILILPCVLLSSLTLVLFWLPPESPAKMQLGMNIFVAFFVLLLLLAESTPPAASSIPLIGAYYCLNMILITLSTFLSVIVVNLYFHGNRTKVPRFLKKIMIDFFARILCMRNQVDSLGVTMADPSTKFIRTPYNMAPVKDKYSFSDLKFDKVGMFTSQMDENRRLLSNGIRAGSDMDMVLDKSQPIAALQSLENEVRDVGRHIKFVTDRITDKDKREEVAKEWKVVALVLDRVFFFIFLACILVSIFAIFPKSALIV